MLSPIANLPASSQSPNQPTATSTPRAHFQVKTKPSLQPPVNHLSKIRKQQFRPQVNVKPFKQLQNLIQEHESNGFGSY